MIERLVVLAVLGSLLVKFISGQWPWVLWQAHGTRKSDTQAEKHARVLLGLAPDAARETIIDAHRRLITQVHPDRGGTSDAVYEANAARDLLLERLGSRNRAPQNRAD